MLRSQVIDVCGVTRDVIYIRMLYIYINGLFGGIMAAPPSQKLAGYVICTLLHMFQVWEPKTRSENVLN